MALALIVPAAFAGVARADTENFSNPNPIAVPGTGTSGVANPYPSIIRLSGFNGLITNVTVRLENLAHTFPDDIDVLLVGPAGQRVILMSDTGGANDVNVDLNFADTAPNNLPDGPQIITGTYKPTNIGAVDPFAAPAPNAPPLQPTLGAYNGTNPNGDWRLFVVDDAGADVGSIAGGWTLTITTPAAENPQGQPVTGPGTQTLRRGSCTNAQRGTRGRDVIRGTRAGDRLSGLGGNDVLNGQAGNDCLSGGSGNDFLRGATGRDRLSGGSGRDRLSGGDGNDRLSGGSGGDRLTGGTGRNVYSAGSGNDSINSANGRRDRVNCGAGRDNVRADRFDRLARCERVLR